MLNRHHLPLLAKSAGITVILFACTAFGFAGRHHARQTGVGQQTAAAPVSIAWRDLSGRAYGMEDIAKAKATVFLFSSTECPVAGKYAPRMAELGKAYQQKGVAFFLVNANRSDSAPQLARYVKERGLGFAGVKDEGTKLADHLGASVTPEAVVVDASGVVRYLGRIDDNSDREKVTRRDLANALDAVLAGQPVKYPRLRAQGCTIFRDTPDAAPTTTVAKAVYTHDVAPILQKNCVVCHRVGDAAPFSLETYAQAKTWASAIKDYSARRLMPPWKAVPGNGEFHDARWLSETEIGTLARWADAGAPEGNKKDLPAPAKFAPSGSWELGKPDLVVSPLRPYHLEAEGRDVYRDFTLPVDFNEDRYVSAFDFKPSNRAIVHHIIAYIDVTGDTTRARDNKEAEPGWSVSGGGSGIKDDEWGQGWAPGMNPRKLDPGVAVRIPKGAKLVLQVHYHKTGKPEADQSQVAIYWAKEPVQKVLQTWALGTPLFRLKPGEKNQMVKAAVILPYAVTVRAVLPHMHMLGTEMKVTATLPDGTTKPLIYVKNWDFNWQMAYRYKEPVSLPKGTRLSLVALYDNTAQNPNQPSNPPQLVHFGEQTTDEMCFAFLGFTRDKAEVPADAPAVPKGSL